MKSNICRSKETFIKNYLGTLIMSLKRSHEHSGNQFISIIAIENNLVICRFENITNEKKLNVRISYEKIFVVYL